MIKLLRVSKNIPEDYAVKERVGLWRARVCVCSGRGQGHDFSPEAAELSASVIRAREKRTGEDIRWVNLSEFLCARLLFAATASDRLSSDWFPAKLHTCWRRGTR